MLYILFFAVLFCVCLAVSFALHSLGRKASPPPEGAAIKLRQGASIFLCRMVRARRNEWSVTKPFLASDVRPLRPRNCFLAEFVDDKGVHKFFTSVRQEEGGWFLSRPDMINHEERRLCSRKAFLPALHARLGKYCCELRDIGQGGAMCFCPEPLRPGDEASLFVSGLEIPAFVLNCSSSGSLARREFKLRLCFAYSLSREELAIVGF